MARKAPSLPEIQGQQREDLAAWFKERFEELDREREAREEVLRTVGEHPSPIFAKFVKNHGAVGLPKKLVARILEISVRTLDKYYSDDYELGKAEILTQVAANMMRIATSTCDPAAAKVGMDVMERMGGDDWKRPAQKMVVEDDRGNKGRLIDSSNLTREERDQLRVILTRIAEGGAGEPLGPDETAEAIP